MAICKLCQSAPCKPKAHIIPKWAYGNILANGPAAVVPADQDQYIGKSPAGEYDTNLVCIACEELFSPLDSFGCSFFRDSDWGQDGFEKLTGTSYKIKTLPGDHYESLHKFAMSLLWRSSATDRKNFNGVNLGPREQVLGKMLLGNTCSPELFPIRLTRYFTPEKIPLLDPEHFLMNPQSTKISGYSFTRIFIYGFEIFFSTDSRISPQTLLEFCASPKSIPILGQCFTGSPDMVSIKKMIQIHQ